jgi:AcrR family transcriptional regulator
MYGWGMAKQQVKAHDERAGRSKASQPTDSGAGSGAGSGAASRAERRRVQTRAALIDAAQRLLIEDRLGASVLEITQLADVGTGTFYNHFESKEELFRAAVDEALERHGELMDAVAEGVDDPAEEFARSFRLTGRLHRLLPGMSMVLIHRGTEIVMSQRGLAPRALRDIRAAVAAGRFKVDDPELALVAAGGAIIALGQLLHSQPERDAAQAADVLTRHILQVFGLDEAEAQELCDRPLPDLEELLAERA